jgi:regulator of sirC expression with transglutaminase-like and TPR domain
MDTSSQDPLFLLAQQSNSDINLATGALSIAKIAYPKLDIAAYLEKLDDMAAALKSQVTASQPMTRLEELNRYFFGELGFKGNQTDYDDPRNSYLNEVIDRRLGIPITLSIVYLTLGGKLDLHLAGISFPMHFLVKCDIPQGPFFIDPFMEGIILKKTDLAARLQQVQKDTTDLENFLEAATAKQILARMLRNLKQIYHHNRAFSQAIELGEKILWFQPEESYDHRELGFLYYQTKDYHKSLQAFETCLLLATNQREEEDARRYIQTLANHLGALN